MTDLCHLCYVTYDTFDRTCVYILRHTNGTVVCVAQFSLLGSELMSPAAREDLLFPPSLDWGLPQLLLPLPCVPCHLDWNSAPLFLRP